MRVIAGSYKGRTLKSPTWDGLRPTSDRLRETLFNIVAARVPGSRVLDGFAGTGAIGIEALSRGAASVTFVDDDRRAQALVAENLTRCGISEGYAIIRASVARALETLKRAPERFDLIVLDPPYELAIEDTIGSAGELLAPDGVLVLEHSRRRQPPQMAGALVRSRDVRSGDSALAFYAANL